MRHVRVSSRSSNGEGKMVEVSTISRRFWSCGGRSKGTIKSYPFFGRVVHDGLQGQEIRA